MTHTRFRLVALFTLCCAFMAPIAAQAAAEFPPGEERWTVVTPHFRIHAPDRLTLAASQLADIAERYFDPMVAKAQTAPTAVTHIVLTDHLDLVNGYTSVIPYPRIVLYLKPQTNRHTDWLEHVFIHEFAHVLHLDRAEEEVAGLRSAFGRMPLLFPNQLQPRWMLEGYATWMETVMRDGDGRGYDPTYQALMRIAARDGALRPLHTLNEAPPDYPWGDDWYRYGVDFWLDVDQQAPGTVQFWHRIFSGQLIPFRINHAAEAATGKDVATLWRDWQGRLTEQVKALPDPVEPPNTTVLGQRSDQRLSGLTWFQGEVTASIYDGHWNPEVVRWRAGDWQRLARLNAPVRISADGDLIWTADLHHVDTFHQFDTPMTLDPDGLETWQAGEHVADLGAGFGAVVGVRHHPERHDLVARKPDGSWGIVVSGCLGEYFRHPVPLPDGRIALAHYPAGGPWDLAIYDPHRAAFFPLTQDEAGDGMPAFDAVGGRIYWISERSGQPQIDSILPDGSDRIRHTGVIGAAAFPSPSPDGQTLAWGELTPHGWSVRTAPIATLPRLPEVDEAPSPIATHIEPPPKPDYESLVRPYTPWESLTPTWWLPNLAYSNLDGWGLGAQTAGNDAAMEYSYAASLLGYGLDGRRKPRLLWYLTGIIDRWWPTISLETQRQFDFAAHGISAAPPIAWDDWTLYGLAGFRGSKNSWEGWNRYLAAGLALDSRRQFLSDPYPARGGYLRLFAERTVGWLGPLDTGTRLTAEGRGFLRLDAAPGGHPWGVFGVQLMGSDVQGRPGRIGFGGAQSAVAALATPLTVTTPSAFLGDQQPLRGYPRNTFLVNRFFVSRAEWRLPLANTQWGKSTWPIAAGQLFGSVAVDHLQGDLGQKGTGVALELGLTSTLAYWVPTTFHLGVARGLRGPAAITEYYLRMGQIF